MKPIAISLGDPAGIGPEIVARALAERPDTDLLVFGDTGLLARRRRHPGGHPGPGRDGPARRPGHAGAPE